MCILCGEMISTLHWSEVRFKETQTQILVGEEQKQRLQTRLQKVRIINEILEFYGLKFRDWHGSKFLLSNKKGRSVIVNDLGDLWIKAKELHQGNFDALDEKLLNFLRSKNA